MGSSDGYIIIATKIDSTGAELGMAQLQSQLNRKSASISSGVINKFSLIKTGIIGLGLGKIVNSIFNGMASSMDGAISRVDTMGNFSTVMSNLGQSGENAQASIDKMSDSLTGLPTRLDEGASAVQRFTAVNDNVKASTDMYLALNNALLAGNAPMDQQKSALEQITKAYSSNKMEMDQWISAVNAMPAQMKQVAQAMGYTNTEAFGKALRDGKVSMDDFMFKLTELNNGVNGFDAQARDATGGIATSMANMRNAITRGVAEILNTIGQANIASFFQGITKAINFAIIYIKQFVSWIMTAVSFVAGLFGKKAKNNADKTSASIGSASNSMDSLSKRTADTGKNMDKTAKKSKKLQKTLASFDEMNVLQDNKNNDTGNNKGADGGAGGGSVSAPTLDLSGWGDSVKKKMGEINDYVMGALLGIGGMIGALKIAKLLKDLGLIQGKLGALKALGIGLMISGLYLAIKGVIDYIKDPSWENFLKILTGIGLIVAGVALVFGGIPALITAIVGIVIALGLAIYKHWDEVKAVLSKVGSWIYDHIIAPVVNFFKGLWDTIKKGAKALWNFYIGIYATVALWIYDHVILPIVNFFKNLWENLKNGVTTLWNFYITLLSTVATWIYNYIILPVINFFKNLWENLKNGVTTLWNGIKSVISGIANWVKKTIIDPVLNFFKGLWTGIKNGASTAWTNVKNVFSGVATWFKTKVIDKIIDKFKSLGSKVGNTIGGAFKGAINLVLGAVERILNFPIRAINGLIGAVNKLPGISIGTLSTFSLPRLAKGGIINLPGRGIPIGGAIGGERGPEGVIPLTDSQQMALLGEAIGRYITVNNNITTTLNGRVISRELQKINNESDFAFNR